MLKTNYVSVISKEDLETIALKYVLEINTKKGTYSLHSPNSLKCNINELCQKLQKILPNETVLFLNTVEKEEKLFIAITNEKITVKSANDITASILLDMLNL